MKILQKAIMPDGTEIQLEEWNENYSFMPYGSTIASYPKSKASHEGTYSPKGNKKYRFDFSYKSNEEANQAFNELITGSKVLIDFINNFAGKPEYKDCI